MNTYFIRHTGISVDDTVLEKLAKECVIAIHYPDFVDGRDEHQDNDSLDPEDYPRSQGRIIGRFVELGKSGGYVCATYRTTRDVLIGFVDPGTKVKLDRRFRWDGDTRRKAILKTIRVQRAKWIPTSEHAIVSAGRPRQGTFVRWHRAGDVIERLVEGRPLEARVENLTPDRLEMMCSEYLRTNIAKRAGLPKLKFALMPVGRTMRDVDILGAAEDGRKILAQVTKHEPHGPDFDDKLQRLKLTKGKANEHLIMFCDTPRNTVIEDGVHLVSIKQIYERFQNDKGLAGFL